jgi:hypothetical protein
LAEAWNQAPQFRFSVAAKSPRLRLTRLDRRLVAVAAGLGLACATLAAAESYRAAAALEQAQLATHGGASSALAARQMLESRLAPFRKLTQIEAAPNLSAVLAELGTLVPKDAWITTLEFKPGHLRLVGVSPDPAALVTRLTASDIWTDIELRSSLSAGIGTGQDRFEITATTKASDTPP